MPRAVCPDAGTLAGRRHGPPGFLQWKFFGVFLFVYLARALRTIKRVKSGWRWPPRGGDSGRRWTTFTSFKLILVFLSQDSNPRNGGSSGT